MVAQPIPEPAPADATVTVELFGVPRLLAGRAIETAHRDTLGELAAALAARCPELVGPVLDEATGWLRAGYTFVVDERFTRDAGYPVGPGAAVLLVASAAGG
jgi:molybdopterin converting factor small subunit